jgi:hypothetical protein
MAEVIVVIGIATSIAQLVDVSNRVIRRHNEFYSIAGETPKSFRQVKTELPLLGTTLQQIKEAIYAELVAYRSKTPLLPVIAGCQEQVAQLDAIITKTLPGVTDNWQRKGKEGISEPALRL